VVGTVAVLIEVLGLEALVGLVSVTDVFAPPEACATPSCGSVDDDGCVEDPVVDSEGELDDADALVESGAVPVDGESVELELLDEVVDDGSLGSASAIAGLLATAMPTPSAIANAPTLPI
jgi:hypothetical protein